MKNTRFTKNFMWLMLLLSGTLVLLWVVFYYITLEVTKRNMILQAETSSEAIIASIENELLAIDATAYDLAHYDRVESMAMAEGTRSFYDYGAVAEERGGSIVNNAQAADNAVVFRADGLFYRLKGTIPNTALRRVFRLIESAPRSTVVVTTNDTAYVGRSETIWREGTAVGYVALLMEETRIEKLLRAYDDIDYLGVALLSGDRLISSNRNLRFEDIPRIRESAAFTREKDVGLSGFRLLVYCESSVSRRLSRYFAVAMPVTVVILALVMAFFIRYLRRHMVTPINTVIALTRESGDKPLPHTGEEYFDGLVDHVNDMLSRIEDRERALYASERKARESELEKERTLVSLLKKQISAHFTVNTLNVVRALINKGEREAAARICGELSTLLRYANAPEEYISLSDEFYVLRQYVGIMQARYPGKIRFETDEEDVPEDVFIPRMLIQPVVENAIVHGLDGKEGTVSLSAELQDAAVVVTVADDGKGMTADELSRVRESLRLTGSAEEPGIEHVALINIQKRIRVVCGDGYGVELDSAPDEGTRVRLRFARDVGEDALPRRV
ncbi:MAG: hypothetical protein E7474_10040 [Ruminococcaceae bacterium]|nr:hypothetical protein [Oscillospiraceae bacterium]